jgi:hypothetical protein
MTMNKRTALLIGLGVLVLIAACGYYAILRIKCIYGNCPASVQEIRQGVQVSVSSPRNHYELGDAIPIQASIKNVSSQSIVLEASDFPVFSITDSATGIAYWSELDLQPALNRLELDPGEEYEINIVSRPSEPGLYNYAVAYWLQQGSSRYVLSLSIGYGAYRK